jgi:hypothetical protein
MASSVQIDVRRDQRPAAGTGDRPWARSWSSRGRVAALQELPQRGRIARVRTTGVDRRPAGRAAELVDRTLLALVVAWAVKEIRPIELLNERREVGRQQRRSSPDGERRPDAGGRSRPVQEARQEKPSARDDHLARRRIVSVEQTDQVLVRP